MVGVAEWLRHLVVAQKTVGSNPTAHPEGPEAGAYSSVRSRLCLCTGSIVACYSLLC